VFSCLSQVISFAFSAYDFSALRHPACKKWGDGGGGHWLVRMEWRPAGWSVCLPVLIFPCTIKSRNSLLAPAHPDGRGKRAVKWLWCGISFGNELLCMAVWHCSPSTSTDVFGLSVTEHSVKISLH